MKKYAKAYRFTFYVILLILFAGLSTLIATTATSKARYVVNTSDSFEVTVNNALLDYQKVYGDAQAPYTDKDGAYYIRYTGEKTHRTLVDLDDDLAGGVLLNTPITSTYKMFEKATGLQAVDTVILTPELSTAEAITDNIFYNYTGTAYTDKVNLVYRDSVGELAAFDALNTDVSAIPGMRNFYLCLADSLLTGGRYAGTVPNIYVPSDITSISSLFYSNTALRKPLLAADGAWEVATNVFRYCEFTLLPDDFRLPSTLVSISYFFGNCQYLTSLPDGFTIPNEVAGMDGAFFDCQSLTSLPASFTIGTSVTASRMKAMTYVFYACSSLQSLPEGFTIPNGVNSIMMIFYNCSSLASLPDNFTIGTNVKFLTYAFGGCSALTSLPAGFSIPVSATEIPGIFMDCSALSADITIPNGVTNMFNSFANAGAAAPKLYAADGTPGTQYAIVMRYYTTCTAAVNYVPPSEVTKVIIA